MTGVTHAAAGAAVGAVAGALSGHALAGATVGAVAALLPDVDHPGSYAGRYFRPLACRWEEKYGHRSSPSHTVQFAALTGFALGLVAAVALHAALLVLAGILGGCSHILLDGLTRSGVCPWRVYLPRLPGKVAGKLPAAGKWNDRASRWEAHRWKDRQYRWEIYTGQDDRETMIFIASLLILAAVLLAAAKM